jgi:creatinine amidohydrolase/Fe(II)-dependent formamide hydrolase-like protein
MARLPEGAPVLLLPTTRIGKSDEHLAYKGTLTLSAATLGAVWHEIGVSVRRAGVRKLILLNGHGGQTPGRPDRRPPVEGRGGHVRRRRQLVLLGPAAGFVR